MSPKDKKESKQKLFKWVYIPSSIRTSDPSIRAVQENFRNSMFGIYEGRLKSSWTHLITPCRWRCDDGLFFEVPPLASDAHLTTLHPLLENVLQTVDHFEISCLRAPFFMVGKAQISRVARTELNSVFGLEKVDRWNPIRTSAIQSRSRPMRFLGFSKDEKDDPRQEMSK
jgi:hypothetical protein